MLVNISKFLRTTCKETMVIHRLQKVYQNNQPIPDEHSRGKQPTNNRNFVKFNIKMCWHVIKIYDSHKLNSRKLLVLININRGVFNWFGI